MTSKGNILSPNEVNQSYVRTINTLLITIYILIYAHINSSQLITNYSTIALLYLFITIPLYFWSLRCINLGLNSKERHYFRIIGLTSDLIFLSIVISLSGPGGIPLFFVYLWIVVGNGIRYGANYLKYTTVVSVILFCIVILVTDIWKAEYLVSISIGFMISLYPVKAYETELS